VRGAYPRTAHGARLVDWLAQGGEANVNGSKRKTEPGSVTKARSANPGEAQDTQINFGNGDKPMASETISTNTEATADKQPAAQPAEQPKRVGLGINLIPAQQSDQPVLANFTLVNVAPGMAFVDFGFIEPRVLATLPQLALSGGKMPEKINGRLAVRVAIGFDALQSLHQQLGRVTAGLEAARDSQNNG
jgi:hypothetical protein